MSSVRAFSQHFHMWIHLGFGFLAALIYQSLYSHESFFATLTISLVASILPDIDHIFFFFFYGAKSPYALKVKSFLYRGQFKKAAVYCQENHKHNTSIYSHNVFTLILVLVVSSLLQSKGYVSWGVFALSWSYHYLFDMIEDLLLLGRLNPNWFLKFGSAKTQ